MKCEPSLLVALLVFGVGGLIAVPLLAKHSVKKRAPWAAGDPPKWALDIYTPRWIWSLGSWSMLALAAFVYFAIQNCRG